MKLREEASLKKKIPFHKERRRPTRTVVVCYRQAMHANKFARSSRAKYEYERKCTLSFSLSPSSSLCGVNSAEASDGPKCIIATIYFSIKARRREIETPYSPTGIPASESSNKIPPAELSSLDISKVYHCESSTRE